jgi:hypothetical protein
MYLHTRYAGVTPALRTSFKGDALCTKAAGRMTGPVAKSEAWVRVVPSNSVSSGKQADALVAGTRKLLFFFDVFICATIIVMMAWRGG